MAHKLSHADLKRRIVELERKENSLQRELNFY